MTHSPPDLPASLWQLKPWWCQPWSIILTGILVPVIAWSLLHRLWIVVPLSLVILLWWVVFLYLVPRQYAEVINSQKHSS
jgi:membrane protein YdbS with pleckstrin-like domain